MKLPNWLRIVLWLILIAFFSWLLSQRYTELIKGVANTIDIIILLIWIALIAAFIFQEVDFFGVRLKREINTLRAEFKEHVLNLRADIQNTINMRAEISQQVQVLTPPTDSELQEIKKESKPVLEQIKEKGIEKPTSKFEIPKDNQFLFEVRYTIENELRRIWKQWKEKAKETALWTGQRQIAELERPQSVFQIAGSLTELNLIDPRFSSLIREVYRVCSSAIHGEEVSQTAVGFVHDVAPSLIGYLKSTNVNWLGQRVINKTEENKS